MKKTNVNRLVMMTVLMCSVNVLAEDVTFTEETAAAYLKLTPPVKVLHFGMYWDGGSIDLSGADAAEFHILDIHPMAVEVDGKVNLPESIREQYKDKTNFARRIFIGKKRDLTEKLEVTSLEEGRRIKAAVECLAGAWFDREATPGEKTRLMEHFQQVRRGEGVSYLALMNELAPPRKLTEAEEKDETILRICLEKQRRFTNLYDIAAKLSGIPSQGRRTEPPSVLAADTVFTEEKAAAYLKLMPPVEILLYFQIGRSSIGISLTDAKMNELHILQDSPNLAGRIFIGEGSPTKNQKITSETEGQRIKAAVDCLAIAWLDREFTPEEQTLMALPQEERRVNSQFLALEKRMIPQKENVKTEEEKENFLNDRMAKRIRFESARYVAGELKGMAPSRKKVETAEPKP